MHSHDHSEDHGCCSNVWVTAAVLTIMLAVISAACRHFPTANCYVRMALYYASILLAGVLAMFGAVPTYFYNRVCHIIIP